MYAFAFASNFKNGFFGNKSWCSYLTFAFDGKDQRKTQTHTLNVNKALTDTGPNLNSSKKLELSKVSNNSHIPSSQIQLNYPRQTLRRVSLQFNTNMMHNTVCCYFGNKQTFKMTFLMKIWWRLNARRPQCNSSMWWHVQAHQSYTPWALHVTIKYNTATKLQKTNKKQPRLITHQRRMLQVGNG